MRRGLEELKLKWIKSSQRSPHWCHLKTFKALLMLQQHKKVALGTNFLCKQKLNIASMWPYFGRVTTGVIRVGGSNLNQ